MKTTYYVGIDMASATFVASLVTAKVEPQGEATQFANEPTGYEQFTKWLLAQGATQAETALCLEATGVYGEELAYWLTTKGWWLAVIPPLEVKRASPPHGAKNDSLDSYRIAEYGARYWDKLHQFVPKPELLEQVRVLLQLREQYVRQKTAHHNGLHAIRRKAVKTPLAESLHRQSLDQLKQHIKTIEVEIRKLFDQDPDLRQQLTLLMTIPGVGLLLASHMVCLAASLRSPFNPRTVASHLGLAPLEHQSGSSIWRPPISRRFGPATIRKLLHLAARSQRTHHPPARDYFDRKLQAGKPKMLILNNLANRLIRVMCAILRSRKPFDSAWCSLSPQRLIAP